MHTNADFKISLYVGLHIKRLLSKCCILNPNFASILVPEVNRKQNPNISYTNKYQNHVPYSYGYKLVCVHDQFSKLLSRT